MQKPYRLRLMDTYRNLFYTPIYTAVSGGFLYAEGLDVMFGTVPAGRPPLDMLRQGEVDIIQSGISRSLMALDDGDEDAPLHIAEINQRDGFFLVSSAPHRQLAMVPTSKAQPSSPSASRPSRSHPSPPLSASTALTSTASPC